MIIDCHMHPYWQGRSAEAMIEHMDKNGIDMGCLLNWEAIDGGLLRSYHHLSTADVFQICEQYPDRFFPWSAVDPRRADAEAILRDLVARGLKGFGELKLPILLDSPELIYMYRLCAEFDLPVLLHLQEPTGSLPYLWYCGGLEVLERTLIKCPDTTFLGHGQSFWSGFHCDGPVGGKVGDLLERYDNLHADISAGSGHNALSKDLDVTRRFFDAHYRKCHYGTDLYERMHLDLLEELNLPSEMFDAIGGGNTAKLMKFDVD